MTLRQLGVGLILFSAVLNIGGIIYNNNAIDKLAKEIKEYFSKGWIGNPLNWHSQVNFDKIIQHLKYSSVLLGISALVALIGVVIVDLFS